MLLTIIETAKYSIEKNAILVLGEPPLKKLDGPSQDIRKKIAVKNVDIEAGILNNLMSIMWTAISTTAVLPI